MLTHTIDEYRSSGVLVNSATNSDARPANHNAQTKNFHFLVRWTCVIVICVTGTLIMLVTPEHSNTATHAYECLC